MKMPRRHGDLGAVDPIMKIALIFLLAPLAVVGAIAIIAVVLRRLGLW